MSKTSWYKRLAYGAVASAMVFTLAGARMLPAKADVEAMQGDPIVRFGVLSDTHIKDGNTPEQDRLKKALEMYKTLDPNMDMVAIVGDLTDYGKTGQYDRLMQTLNDNKISNNTKVFMSMGNHDYYDLGDTSRHQEMVDRFLSKTGMEAMNYRKVINGYQFIFVSPTGNTVGRDNYKPSIEWLKTQLAAAQAENEAAGDATRPIFVFSHHGMSGTTFGDDLWKMDGTEQFYNALKEYPSVIHMSGHTHFSLNDPRSIDQTDFTALKTATLSYLEIDEKDGNGNPLMGTYYPPGSSEFAQGYVVDVEAGKVTIRRIDIYNNKFIGEPWVIENGNLTTYTKGRAASAIAPSFPADAAAAAKNVSDAGARIEFTQANPGKDTDIVYRYHIKVSNVTDPSVKDQEYNMWSDFYKGTIAPTMSVGVSKLAPNTQYKAVITAYEPWGKASTNKVETTFTTMSEIDANVVVPAADMFDFSVADGSAKDVSAKSRKIEKIGNPIIEMDAKLNRNVAKFTGSGADYFKTPFSDADYDAIKDKFTYEAVFKFDEVSSTEYVPFGSMQQGGFGISVLNGKVLTYMHISGAYVTLSSPIEAGKYVHVAVTYDGSKLDLYVDGKLAESKSVSGTLSKPSTDAAKCLVVGADTSDTGTSQDAFKGTVAMARLYSEPLNFSQVNKSMKTFTSNVVDEDKKDDNKNPGTFGAIGVIVGLAAAASVGTASFVFKKKK